MQEDSYDYVAKSAQLFPQSLMLVLHQPDTNKIYLHLVSRNRYSPYDHAMQLITTVPVSEFSPYFMLYPEQVQEVLTAEIISAIGRASRYGKKYHKANGNPFPGAFKRLARKLIRAYRYCLGGEFVTKVFISKLYHMLRVIWVHSQTYFRWHSNSKKVHARLQQFRPIQSFQYEC